MGILICAVRVRADSLAWRGDGTGCYPDATPPLKWGTKSGIVWQAEVGKGQSCPVIVGKRIFITAEPDKLICLDRDTGAVLWSKSNGYDSLPTDIKPPAKQPGTTAGCGYATPTPISDGKRIFTNFGTGIVVAYDLDGNRKWIRLLDLPLVTQYGRAGSPVLVGGKLLVSIGGLVALDAQTGKTIWQQSEAKPTYGTPVAAKIGEAEVVVTPGGDCVRVSDGKILASKLANLEYASPIIHDGVAYFAASTVTAVKLPDQKLWENEDLDGEFFASPVLHDGLLFCASNLGKFYALDAKTGKTVLEKECAIGSQSGKPGTSPANIYPSLTLAGKVLLFGNDAGETLVLAPTREFKEIAHNYLSAGSGASAVADGNRLYLRSGAKLYCIGEK